MNKKLQVFISSTYTDLQEERQAAVEAVLKAGHIPAGMELFRSADESQKETITKWIKESDVYLLILGGRYGTIEPTSNKSYTHWEYDFAGEIGIPRFAVVMSEETLAKKIKKFGELVLERNHLDLYTAFKSQVLSKTSHFFDDLKDIKITVMQTLNELLKDEKLSGWVAGKELEGTESLRSNLLEFAEENRMLKKEIDRLNILLKTTNEKKSVKLNKNVDFEGQVKKVLLLLGAHKLSLIQMISWKIDLEDGTEKEISLPHPPNEFYPYFIYSPDFEIIQKLLIVTISDDSEFDLQARLGDIRVLINKYREAEGVPIKFVLAIPGEHGSLQENVEEFLKKAVDIEPVREKDLFEIQIWDTNVIKHFEEKLGLTLKY